MSRRRRSLGTGALVALLVVGGAAWATGHLDLSPEGGTARATSTDRATSSTAPAAGGYERDAFGPSWADSDHNGCDQRNDVLARDMSSVTFKPGTHECVVLSGILHDAYTGKTIDFRRGEQTSMAVQIDHIVPLSWAWQHGANSWDAATRERFATDLANLQAVDGPTNASKSDQGPSTWMPPVTGYACTYADRFEGVADAYGLDLPQPDRTVIDRALTTCG